MALTVTKAPTSPAQGRDTSLGAIWPSSARRLASGMVSFNGVAAVDLAARFGTPQYLLDLDELTARAVSFRNAAAEAFTTATTHVSFAGKAFLSKEAVRLLLARGLSVDTCSMGEMQIALAAGAPGRRLVLHGNNKSDEELRLAISRGFAKIVVDSPDEPARIAAIAHRLGRRARVMVRVTVGIHAGGHDYISTAHEDQKFGVPLLPAGSNAAVLDYDNPAVIRAQAASRAAEAVPPKTHIMSLYAPQGKLPAGDEGLAAAMAAVAQGQAVAVLKDIRRRSEDLELVGIHAHIGSQIHGEEAFVESARRLMLLRKTFWATDGFILPEVDLGGGYSVAYTDADESMDIEATMHRLAATVASSCSRLGLPMPVISFEPGRWIVAPAGVTLYRVGTVKPVALDDGRTRIYVSVDGGMSDNIRPALYGAAYTATLANRRGAMDRALARVVGMHCESGDIVVRDVRLPADVRRGDLLAVPATGAYGRTMAINYNQALIPPVVGLHARSAHLMIRRQTIDDLLALDQS